jgi:mono/diheme cytochrome c family protein
VRNRLSTHHAVLSAFVAFSLLGASCEKSGEGTSAPDAAAETTAQVKEGAGLYKEHCAGCHGPAGKGGEDSPPLIGADAMPPQPAPSAKTRTANFDTAADVLAYVVEHMPEGTGAGQLMEDEHLAIMAWILNVNGWKRQEVLTTDNASAVQLSR